MSNVLPAALVLAGLVVSDHAAGQAVRDSISRDPSGPQPQSSSEQDTFRDGTPDFTRLDSPQDRQAFRGWFAVLAEYQALRPPADIPEEVNDCSALLRYAYRNGLHRHDETWLRENKIVPPTGLSSIGKYAYPYTPLRAKLFRVRPGPFRPSDLSDGAFSEFADANTLRQWNTHFVSKDIRAAQPGDLLFYRQLEQNSPFHSMVFIGRSRWNLADGTESATDIVVYHTGPIGERPGEMRRTRVAELLQHPSPRWRPIPGNENFLGVYRWNILRETN